MTLLDIPATSNNTLLTIALVLFIICAVVWLLGWGWSRWRP